MKSAKLFKTKKMPIFLTKTETTSMSKKTVTLTAVDQMIQYSLELFIAVYSKMGKKSS